MYHYQVRFFASLREQLGLEALSLDSATPVETVADLVTLVGEQQGSHIAQALLADNLLVAINHEMSSLTQPISSGDEVAFFPPVTGG